MTFGFNMYICCLILAVSGAFNGSLKRAGLSPALAYSFFLLAAVFSLMEDIQVLPSLYINAGGFILPMALSLMLIAKVRGRDKLMILIFSVIAGVCAYLVTQVFAEWIESVFPSMIWPRTVCVLLFSVLLCASSRDAIVCSFFGLYISTLLELLDSASGISVTAFGSGLELNAAAIIIPAVILVFELARIGKEHYKTAKPSASLNLGGR